MVGAKASGKAAREIEESTVEDVVDDAVHEVVSALAAQLVGVKPPPAARVRRVRTAEAVYHIRGGLIAAGQDSAPTVFVVVDRRRAEPPPVEEIRSTFGLTRKEAIVARLLAWGLSNSEIAAELVVSPHTARHHTESVFLKLGINTRESVREVIQDSPVDRGRESSSSGRDAWGKRALFPDHQAG